MLAIPRELHGPDTSTSALRHPADRWAYLVWATRDLPYDPRTLGDWANAVGVSVPTLRARCYVAGVSPRASLILTRLVRAVRLAPMEGVNLVDLLDVKEPRTARKLIRMTAPTGLGPDSVATTLQSFLEAQTVVTAPQPLQSLRRLAMTDSRSGCDIISST